MAPRILLLLVFLLQPLPASAAGEADAFQRFFEAERLESDWFAPSMLQAVPLATMQELRDGLTADWGPYQDAATLQDRWQVRLEKALLPARIALDAEGRIASLWFGVPLGLERTLEQVAADIADLPGTASLLLVRDGEPLFAIAAEEPLAVGSAFKLAVLKALAEAVEETALTWEEPLTLRHRHKSLPTGILQDWPAGTALTLESAAALMISISDNTATDALIDYLGVTRVEPLMPPDQRPLLSTRQYFVLASAAHADERAEWDTLTEDQRRAVLVGLRFEQPSLADYLAGGAGPDFGWQLAADDLCAWMDELLGLPLLAINPGLAYAADWRHVGYKGGSVPGAINLTTGLESYEGRRYCVSVTWNRPEGIDQDRIYRLYGELLALLPRE